MDEEKEKEVVHKKEITLERNPSTKAWTVTKAKGFFPENEIFTEDELRLFLRQNEDVKPNLIY